MVSFAEIRKLRGLTLPETANELGVSLSTIYRWERGEISPKPIYIRTLASKLEQRGDEGSIDFRFADLFAGVGALRLGFESVGGECVFTSEWDKYCQTTYARNFGTQHEIAGDIDQIPPDAIPKFDVLLAGFPCQPFSIAGVSKKKSLGRPHGFDDLDQGNLFFTIHSILKHHRPAAFVLENVRNLVSHDQGTTFDVIHRLLSNGSPSPTRYRKGKNVEREEEIQSLVDEHTPLRYHLSYRVIDAKSWVPQHRERIFIVGFKDDVGFDIGDMAIPDTTSGPKLREILHENAVGERMDGEYVLEDGSVNPKYTLSPALWEYLQRYAEDHRARGNGFGFGLVGPDDVARTLSARYYKDGSEILVRQETGSPRRLTPRECARLMGFRKGNGEEWEIPVSDTQAYKQFGNAAVVPVLEHLASYMEPFLRRAVDSERGGRQPTLPIAKLGAPETVGA